MAGSTKVEFWNFSVSILIYKSQQHAHVTEFILLITALHVSGVNITHLQEHKTTVTTEFRNRYTVIERVKCTNKEYQ
jgi:hypothetical protein